ncbi:hypothetical protein OSTOST_16726, partial [Ostertagia ostertagi]
MKVLAFAVLVAVCVEAMPEQRHKSHSLHSSTEKREKLFERRKRKAVDENENEMGDTIEEINKKSGTKRSRLPSEKQRSYGGTTRALISKNTRLEEPGFTVNFLDVADGDGCVSQVGKPKKVRRHSRSAKAVERYEFEDLSVRYTHIPMERYQS